MDEEEEQHESYRPGACCGDDCWAIYRDDEPCWGDVEVIDEVVCGSDWAWVHGCQGHLDQEKPYVPFKEGSGS